MNDQIIKLKKLSKNPEQILLILQVLEIIQDQNLSKIVETYQKVIQGGISIVEVTSRVALDDAQKVDLEKKVVAKFDSKQLIFDYEIDKNLGDPLVIRIEDKEYRYSVA